MKEQTPKVVWCHDFRTRHENSLAPCAKRWEVVQGLHDQSSVVALRNKHKRSEGFFEIESIFEIGRDHKVRAMALAATLPDGFDMLEHVTPGGAAQLCLCTATSVPESCSFTSQVLIRERRFIAHVRDDRMSEWFECLDGDLERVRVTLRSLDLAFVDDARHLFTDIDLESFRKALVVASYFTEPLSAVIER